MTLTPIELAGIVRDLYGAFQRGDIGHILGAVDENAAWERWEDNSAQKAGVPWLLAGTGQEGGKHFFGVVGQMKFHRFEVLNVLAGGNEVAALVEFHAELPNGRQLRDEKIDVFTFNPEGKIVGYRQYVDTAKHIAAAGEAK